MLCRRIVGRTYFLSFLERQDWVAGMNRKIYIFYRSLLCELVVFGEEIPTVAQAAGMVLLACNACFQPSWRIIEQALDSPRS